MRSLLLVLAILALGCISCGPTAAAAKACAAVPGHYSVVMDSYRADMFVTSAAPQTFFLVLQDNVQLTRATSRGDLCSDAAATTVQGAVSGKAWVSDFTWNLVTSSLTIVLLDGTDSGTLVKVDNVQTVNWLALAANPAPAGPPPVSVLFDPSCGAGKLAVNEYMTVEGTGNPGAYFLSLLHNGQVVIQEGYDPEHAGAFVWRSTTSVFPPSEVYYARPSFEGRVGVFAGRWLSGYTDYVVNSFGVGDVVHFVSANLRLDWAGHVSDAPQLVMLDSNNCANALWTSAQPVALLSGPALVPAGICTASDPTSGCTIEMTVNVDGSGSGVDHCDGERAYTFNATSTQDGLWSTLSPEYTARRIRYATFSLPNSPGSLTFTRYDNNGNSVQLQAQC